MNSNLNPLGQPIGFPLAHWTPPPSPPRLPITGTFCRLEPLSAERHAAALFAANSLDDQGSMWTYLPCGPFESLESYAHWIAAATAADETVFFAIIDAANNSPVGVCAFLRIDRANGSIEIGHLAFSPRLQRTPAATEAMYLLMNKAFELGYRRYEWKCDALNAPSRSAAQRLGFTFEGIFRQAVVYKNRNRDTAWFSILDTEWPRIQAALLQWLNADNFDVKGRQKKSLREFAGIN